MVYVLGRRAGITDYREVQVAVPLAEGSCDISAISREGMCQQELHKSPVTILVACFRQTCFGQNQERSGFQRAKKCTS
jgi:hypothetical protein